MNKAIERFLEEICEEVEFGKKRIDVKFKSREGIMSVGADGKDKHIKILKEVAKYL